MARPSADVHMSRENAQILDDEGNDVAYTRAGVMATEDGDDFAATAAPGLTHTSKTQVPERNNIVIRTHDGTGYVLPRGSWRATKLHLEEIYKLGQREALAEAVRDGKFSLTDGNGNIILPSLWNQVVQAGETLQVVIPAEVLNPDIAANYPDIESIEAEIRLPEDPPEASSTPNDSASDEWGAPGNYEDSSDDSSGSGSTLDLESSSSESEAPARPPLRKPRVEREIITPTDSDGNSLVSTIDTTHVGTLIQNTTDTTKTPNMRDPQQLTGNTESISIGKANTVQTDGRTALQLHLLPGPRTTSVVLDEQIRWVHLRSAPLDLRGYRDTCLSISELSGRQRALVNKLFDKIEKDKLKVFLGGMFIEPGTVLRVDEDCVADPGSVIFSCLPYFDLQLPLKKTSTTGQTLRSPSRSLMQSYYPYEPVEERDSEQAYRRFDNEKRGALVYVPNFWIVNIGPGIVVTCSHQSLQDSFGQSIKLRTIDSDFTKDGILKRDIRVMDSTGRRLILTAEECRSYFQLEQRIREMSRDYQFEQETRELRRELGRSNVPRDAETMDLTWKTKDREVEITPRIWAGILCHRDNFFIDINLSNRSKKAQEGGNEVEPPTSRASNPFFSWPSKPSSDGSATNSGPSEKMETTLQCLENVEKGVLSEVLSNYGLCGPVEKTFTSTQYYRTLPQATGEQVKTSVGALKNGTKAMDKSNDIKPTTHEVRIFQDQEAIIQKAVELYEIKCKTFALFVADDLENALLRKSWAALQSIYDISTLVSGRKPHKLTPNATTEQRWFVRPHFSDEDTSEPTQELKRSFERCRKCQMTASYATSQEAFLHIQKHLKHVSGTNTPKTTLEDSIVNYDQLKLEQWTKGCADILSKACKIAQLLLKSAKDLSDGVMNEDGHMSELYTLPRSILDAFRQLVIFYFAVERAMFYTEDSFKNDTIPVEKPRAMTNVPFSPNGLQVLEAFGNGVQEALLTARDELCAMAKSLEPIDTFDRLSLSAEYICGWFMRRSIVKPLQNHMTVSDMYREYLSTIQFQVNHRPGKRLLRSINLLQEEIAALQEVNSQQTELVLNYMSVLDDRTYKMDSPRRKAMYPYESMLLGSCQEYLRMSDQEYRYLLARCGPLSDSTKQSLEINEEDHGKAIMVFTIVTVIFLPLSFVTSFLGMNTTDIRDMGSSSTLFWTIAIPLTAVTMGSVLYIGYNGDNLRDFFETLYRSATGKQSRSTNARGISVAQRMLARKQTNGTSLSLDFSSLADEAEFADPRPEAYHRSTRPEEPQYRRRQYTIEAPTLQWEPYKPAGPNVTIYNTTRMENAEEEMAASIPQPYHRTAPNRHAYPQHRHSVPQTHVEPATYRTSRPRPRLSTINEPIVLDNLPPPPPVAWMEDDSDEWYRNGRVYEEDVPQQYKWVKKSHRHHHSARRRDRRGEEHERHRDRREEEYRRPRRRDTDEYRR